MPICTAPIAAWVVAAATYAAPAEEKNPSSAAPTCAFIDFDRSPLAAVLEAKLLADVEATWLERTVIDEVVKEQELQALFTPEGGAQRAALGKLLKADLLVMVRNAPPKPVEKAAKAQKDEKPVEAVELAVTETRRGLRLCSRAVPRSADAEADSDTLVELVREALAKHAQQVTEIYAVPPFVSRDLGYEHDYLRGAYSKLLEQMLLDRPGALVVELAEAQALAKEVALADPGSRIERDVPFYLLGEYRNDGVGADRRVRLSLKLMLGEQQLEERSLEPIPPNDAAAVLRKLAGELAGWAAGAKQAAVDPAAEIEALNRREKLFLKLGQWSDALSLAEASLLLKPDQEPLLVDAIVALIELSSENWHAYPVDLDRMRLAMNYDRRGLQHLERFAALGGLPEAYDQGYVGIVQRLFSHTLNDMVNDRYAPERNRIIVELQTMRTAAILAIIPNATRLKWKDANLLVRPILKHLPLKEQVDLAFRLIVQMKDFPGTKQRTISYANQIGFTDDRVKSRELFESFYDRLSTVPNAEIQEAASDLKRRLASMVKDHEHRKTREAASATAEARRRAGATPAEGVREVEFAWEDDFGASGVLKSFPGCLPIGDNLDLLWKGSQLFLMRQPGRLKRVFQAGDKFFFELVVAGGIHDHICYDGKFVWAALAGHFDETPRVIVLDPETEKCFELTSDDGLPVEKGFQKGAGKLQVIALAPLSPGKVCLAGSFGHAWLAVAEFDGLSFKPVRVFHEAREAEDRTTRQFGDVHLAFNPSCMLSLVEANPDGRRKPRIVVGRGGSVLNCPPLLIDSNTLAVSTAPIAQLDHPLPGAATQGAVGHDGFYIIRPPRPGAPLAICRIELPRFELKPVVENVPPGFIVLKGQEFHILGRQWWLGRFGDSQLRCLAETLPWGYRYDWFVPARPPDPPRSEELPDIRRVFRSSHYGILVQRSYSPLHDESTYEARKLLAVAAKVTLPAE